MGLLSIKMQKNRIKQFNKGFTLIELLVVVSVLGVLVGVTVSVMGVNRTRNSGEDGVRIANVSKIAQGIEAFLAAEGRLPVTDPTTFNPLNGPDAATIGFYISAWPVANTFGAPAGTIRYQYSIVENSSICISVQRATDANQYYKYISPWDASLTGGRRACASTVVVCANAATPASVACDGALTDNDFAGCSDLSNVAC